MDPTAIASMRELEDHHWWFVARRKILGSLLTRLELGPSSLILEVGAGTGGNLAMLSRFGSVSAIEPDATAMKIAADRDKATIKSGHLPDNLPFADGGFALAAALDVLEHVKPDNASLSAIGKKLQAGGYFLLTVPAYRWLWSDHDELHHHFHRYTKKEICDKLIAAGFVVEKASYFNCLLFPVLIGARSIKKAFGLTVREDVMFPGWLNSLFRAIFSSERWLLRYLNLPFGSSIVVVARRSTEKPHA